MPYRRQSETGGILGIKAFRFDIVWNRISAEKGLPLLLLAIEIGWIWVVWRVRRQVSSATEAG